MTQFLMATPNGLVYRNNNTVQVAGNSNETALVSGTLKPGMLSMNNRVKYTLICTLSTATLTPGTLTIRCKFGLGVLTLGGGALTLIGGASNTPFRLNGRVSNKGATNAQVAYGEILQASGGLSLVQPVSQAVATMAVDSTAAQALAITAQFSTANANNILTVQDFEMEIS